MNKRVFKLFFVWQDESEEQWLSSMAEKGWIFKKYMLFYYIFEKKSPANYLYKLDYRTNYSNFKSYQALFEEAGWKYVTSYLGWHYFRGKKAEVFTEELYSDQDSLIGKYRRVLQTLLTVLLAILVLNIPPLFYVPKHIQWYLLLLPVLSIILFVLAIILIQKKIKRVSETKML
ncbi:DUF2812 domain-containing protein [Aquibacillus rhizosphaerae]|uniref:DUF2812 domain-containing protein n=1 Tax=Aquibacillus rhizosphaerae TaxID=3051431 RepID=A0ABT7LA42_9BACI|nr:DUF2812 domain-containing protein [Aquibacillus sp. LR5S19]MDL4842742.1 DUF2812 domain-containing protein [Aquibacillus sp. LR5S19]